MGLNFYSRTMYIYIQWCLYLNNEILLPIIRWRFHWSAFCLPVFVKSIEIYSVSGSACCTFGLVVGCDSSRSSSAYTRPSLSETHDGGGSSSAYYKTAKNVSNSIIWILMGK